MNEELLEQLYDLEEVLLEDAASPEDIETFFDLWPEIMEAIKGIGKTDPDGTYHKPEITDIEELTEDNNLDSMYNLLSDVETTLCRKEYAEEHLRFCREVLELINTDGDRGFFDQYETGIARALVDLGRYYEAKVYYESLLKKEVRYNYICNAIMAAYDMKDGEWMKAIVGKYVTGKTLPEDNAEIQRFARDMLARLG